MAPQDLESNCSEGLLISMATESPMRMVESGQTSKWLSSKDTATLRPLFKGKATEELGFFVKGQKFSRDQADFVPSRGGSAPPSMEGSRAAVGNMLTMKDSSLSSSSDNLGNALNECKSEGRWLFDPSYVAYSSPDVSLYPRLPPRHLGNPIGSQKENRGRISSDNGSSGSLHMYHSPLSTHKKEADKENSPKHAFENLAQDSSILKLGQNAALSGSRHKSLVDLIQEDFPRTPSPVYNQSHMSSHATTEDLADAYVHVISSSVSSTNIANLSNSATCSSVVETGVLSVDSCESISKEDPPETFANSQHVDGTKTSPEGQSCNENEALKDDVSTNGVMGKEEHKLRASNAEVRRHQQEQHYCTNNLKSFTYGYPYQVPGLDVQVISQGTNNSQSYLGKLAHSHALFSSVRAQPSLPSPGLSGPLYAPPTTFVTSGNSFYPNFQPSSLFSPQYSVGGYAMSSALFPPYMTGYSSHGALPFPIEATYGPNLNGQGTSVSSGEGIPHAGDFQNRRNFYGQLESSSQPSFGDPFSIPYYPRPFDVAYTTALQQNQLASRILTGGQVPPQDSAVTAYLDDQAFQPSLNGGPNIPFFPYSSMSGNNPVCRQNGRSEALCSRHRGISSFDDTKKQSFIEELKSINYRKFELSNIAGRIVEFSTDQHGSRFIQQKLESCSAEENISVFEEVLPHASKLMTDVFSNYVIQKFFEHGSPDQRKKLADQLSGQMLPLSFQIALEVIELYQKTRLVQELDGHVMRCVCNQNGNHVIQKCIECIPIDKIKFIISAFRGQVPTLSTHPYGCRVIQRVLEHCSGEEHIQCIVDEILESACVLAQDQYGNYVTQHVLERGKPHERSQIISKLTGKIVQMSQHKYASNVIEKCLVHGKAIEREHLVDEIIGQPGEGSNLLAMMKDQFANYVVQKILEISNDRQREILLDHIRVHLHALKKYTYGKHIVARFEQFAGPGGRDDPKVLLG